VFAQFVTLYLTPVFYTYMDAVLKWRRARKSPISESPSSYVPAHSAMFEALPEAGSLQSPGRVDLSSPAR
jgi:hypothetical protein